MTMKTLKKSAKAIGWLVFGPPAQRRRVCQELASRSANLFGDFPLSEDHKAWREDREFLADYARLSPGNPFSQDRKFTLREFVRPTHGLPGAMAGCGFFVGCSGFLRAQARPDAKLYLFDSFSGLSDVGSEDRVQGGDVREWVAGDLVASQQELQKNLRGFENVVVLPGWIPARFPDVADEVFRLVHIDVDLYQPTRDSLEFFYPRLANGGVIVLDDYGFLTCPGARLAADEFAAREGNRVVHLPTGQGLLIKPGA